MRPSSVTLTLSIEIRILLFPKLSSVLPSPLPFLSRVVEDVPTNQSDTTSRPLWLSVAVSLAAPISHPPQKSVNCATRQVRAALLSKFALLQGVGREVRRKHPDRLRFIRSRNQSVSTRALVLTVYPLTLAGLFLAGGKCNTGESSGPKGKHRHRNPEYVSDRSRVRLRAHIYTFYVLPLNLLGLAVLTPGVDLSGNWHSNSQCGNTPPVPPAPSLGFWADSRIHAYRSTFAMHLYLPTRIIVRISDTRSRLQYRGPNTSFRGRHLGF